MSTCGRSGAPARAARARHVGSRALAARRYFVLADGELRYYKTEKLVAMSNSVPLKARALRH